MLKLPIPLPNSFEARYIEPKFPNWQKSFVSGKSSPLFDLKHGICIEEDELLITEVTFKDQALGPPGHVHGGASAALIDEVMGVLVWDKGFPSVTQSLSLEYKKALPLKEQVIVLSEITSKGHKAIEVVSQICSREGVLYVMGRGSFHLLTPEQLSHFSKHAKST